MWARGPRSWASRTRATSSACPCATSPAGRGGRARGGGGGGVEDAGDVVRVSVRDVARGTVRTVAAGWVVAADGMRSRIRSSLGIAAPGVDGLEHRISALFRAPLWRLAGRYRHGLYMITHAEAEGTLLPAGWGDRWIYALSFDPRAEGVA